MNAFRAIVSGCVVVGLLSGTASATITIDTVIVGNPGNTPDTRYTSPGYGRVDYDYRIGKYEVTTAQYTAFLNAVAGVDAYGLYNTSMWSDGYGCKIERWGGAGTTTSPFQYRVAPDYANRPVNYVSFWDACRFANWLHNGQPIGWQDAGTTETGAYALTTDGIYNNTVVRNDNWNWAVTSVDEWHKAAYYDPNKLGGARYWDYPTRSSMLPGRDTADASGNNANYYTGADPFPIDSGKYYTTVVGEFQNSASPYGTFDQGGNVAEWNETVIGWCRGDRGGAFDRYSPGMSASVIGINSPIFEYTYTGFRVVQLPEPGCAVLFVVGALGTVLRRRRA